MKRLPRLVTLAVTSFSVLLVALAGCAQSPGGPSITPGESLPVSNGRSIYFYSTSASGERIGYTGGPGGMMQGPLACVNCHGPEGRGGTVNFMMQTFDVPDITWPTLTGQYEDPQPFTEETVKRAITQGVDPAGNSLEYPMPRWQMSAQDLDDLVSFIKTLK